MIVIGNNIKIENDSQQYRDASIMKRIIAYIIDICFYVPVATIFILASKIFAIQNNIQKAFLMMLLLVIYGIFLFSYIPKKTNGQTLGKKIMGIRIQHIIEEKELSYLAYFFREYIAKMSFGLIIISMNIFYFVFTTIFKRKIPQTFMLDSLFSVRIVDTTKNIKQV